MPNDVTVDLGNTYIGSAYSPQVEITDTETGHEIAITHASPDGGGQLVTDEFFVPNYSGEEADREAAEAARETAEAERAAAEDARDAAEDARQSAESERSSAESARAAAESQRASAESQRQSAEQARTQAEAGRASAEQARAAAESARASAEQARESASATAVANAEAATSAAQTATTAAQSATSAATTATTNANAATAASQTATTNANNATSAANTAASAANTAAETANTAAGAADTAREGIQDDLADMRADIADKAFVDAYAPLLTAGAADGIKGGGPTVDAAFLHRVTGGGNASDGPATIKAIRGNTLRWNQLVTGVTDYNPTDEHVTYTYDSATGKLMTVVEQSPSGNADFNINLTDELVLGHKYLFSPWNRDATTGPQYYLLDRAGHGDSVPSDAIFIANEHNAATAIRWRARCTSTCPAGTYVVYPQLFDLTAMFGAGSEPSTIEEFTALYPMPYYEYDAGSLLSVNLEGIETVGFNQWDEEWELGIIDAATGVNVSVSTAIRSKNYIPVFSGQTYYYRVGGSFTSGVIKARYYDAEKNYIGYVDANGNQNGANVAAGRVMPSDCYYMRFEMDATYGTTYKGAVCINLSDPARNGNYEPYWSQERSIPATDLRSAGTVYDELREGERITRVGVVDLGTLTWVYSSSIFQAFVSDLKNQTNGNALPNLTCEKYVVDTPGHAYAGTNDQIISTATGSTMIWVRDSNYTDAATFKTAMSGVMLHYELTTPTTESIDPPLNLSYRAAADGTETVLVPEGEMSAPVPMEVVYGSTPDSLRDRILATIAPVENGNASANYAVGSYLVHGGTLCKVTTAIASGEAITIGTNVTATTVMAEVLSLIQ